MRLHPHNSRARATTDAPRDPIVSRKDWRAVCAALLDTGPSDADTPASDVHAHPEGAVDALEDLSDLTADSAEEYVGSGGTESGSDDSDDDYQEGGFVSAKKIGAKSGAARAQHTRTSKPVKGRTLKSSSASDEESEDGKRTRLTARQKQECRSTFALFFPDVTDEDLDRQRIRMNDITRVAKLLKEKISTEETVEMLEAFSTAPDKSMSLADFECMMVAAKMA
ncbi:hypothetical protein L226DRAFT_377837 [Lentinus tigrinus ALCF2SS1-7]|uniref:uncharacterized protein n=1 Tax=Lentinus tigrinus ALCF2SS1-7 TaxID=1328758 RepID=UPI001165C8A7|nr:hypothetical protein L226DRAFT_377837 [Lentinus tigrinus ALCF2SS1-7]